MNYAILLLAGKGTRLGLAQNKVFLTLGLKKIGDYAIETLILHQVIDRIILVHSAQDTLDVIKTIKKYRALKPMWAVLGGEKRQDSVRNGLIKIRDLSTTFTNDTVLIHNGCNPFVHPDEITQLLMAIHKKNTVAAVLAQPVKDTLRTVFDNRAIETLPRETIWQMQTPQAMACSIAMEAHNKAMNDCFYGTDDVELVMRLGLEVTIIPCSDKNFKITTPHDLMLARALVLQPISLIGIGEDSHHYHPNKKGLWLGGVFIKEAPSTIAHTDDDVVLHALYHAILSAIGDDSIGESFPETDSQIKDKTGFVFIAYLKNKLKDINLCLKQIRISITTKQPLIAPWSNTIKKQLSRLFILEEHQVDITATSGQRMSYEGKGKGIRSVVMVALGPIKT